MGVVAMTEFTPWPAAEAELYRRKGMWTNQPLFNVLQKEAADKVALIDECQQWTYGQLNQSARSLAQGILNLGLKTGDTVILQMPNFGEFYEVFFACLMAGIRPVVALPAARATELTALAMVSGAKAYFGFDQFHGYHYEKLAQQLRVETSIQWGVLAGNDHHQVPLANLCNDEPNFELPKIDANDIAFFQLSGGTTGIPKLIPRTHNDYYYSVRRSAVVCGFLHTTRYLVALPAAHNFPLSSPGALGALWAGGSVVLASQPTASHCFELIAKHKVTVTALVPPLLLSWLNEVPNQHQDLSSLSLIQVGGAKLGADVAKRVTPVFGCKLQQVFGMAEGLVNYTRLDDEVDTIYHTQGRPMSSEDQVKVVDEADQPVHSGDVGLLLTKGPYTIRGYYNAPEQNARAFTSDGFYRTGDLVTQDSNGNISVVGRQKEQINRGGEKFATEEVESWLLSHPDVFNAAIIPVPDEVLGEKSCAYVEAKSGISVKQLKQFLFELDIATYKIPDYLLFIDQLPKTAVGKIDKKSLRQHFDLGQRQHSGSHS